jgi:transposase
MPGPVSSTHDCEHSARAAALEAHTAALEKQVRELQKQVDALKARHERRAEKMRAPKDEATEKGERAPKSDGNRNRPKGSRDDLPKETVRTHVPQELCICPACKVEMPKVGETQDTVVERIPARVVHRTVINEVRACSCGRRVTSERPVRAFERSEFGPALVSHVVTAKVADSMPLYRQSNTLLREGIRLHRNTLLDMFHGAAEALVPLWRRMVERVAESALVQADETSIRVLSEDRCRTAYVWVFLNANIISYVFSAGRSGATPRKVLGKADGEQVITVDGYSGYNKLEELDGWTRAGCLAHGRRKLFEAVESAPAAV